MNAAVHRVALDVSGRSPMPSAARPASGRLTSDTGEICWRLPGKDQGVLELRGARTKAVIGHIDQGRIDLGQGVEVEVGRTRTNWCIVALSLLEGEAFDRNPRRGLLVASGITENTDMGWRDESRSTVGRNWGRPPSLVEAITATIRIPRGAAPPVLYPLDDRGQRKGRIAATLSGSNTARFEIGPAHKAAWYEIDYAGGR